MFLLVAPAAAQTRRGVRPRYEPDDLDLPDAGTLELDTQEGVARGDATRIVAPDFEASLGLASFAAIVFDGAYAIEGRPSRRFTFDHSAPDDLWTAGKFLLYDGEGDARVAVGAEVGPKLPFARGAHGLGVEGVGLARLTLHRTHLTGSAGGFTDPRAFGVRPTAFEYGLDLDQDLDQRNRWSFLGELGGAAYRADRSQLHASAGLQWGSEHLDLSVVGLAGLLAGGDRWALYLGVTPRFSLW